MRILKTVEYIGTLGGSAKMTEVKLQMPPTSAPSSPHKAIAAPIARPT